MPAAIAYRKFAAEVLEIYALRAPATCDKVRQVLREFGELDGVTRVTDLKPVTIARWIRAHPGRSPATVDSLLRSFRSAIGIGMASGYLKLSPCAVKFELPDFEDDGPEKVRHHPVADVDRVLALATAEAAAGDWKAGRLEALAYTFAFAALRRNEALHLRREDVQLPRHVLRIARRRQVGLKTRASAALVPMAPALEEVLGRWLPRAHCDWVFPNLGRTNCWTGGPMGQKPLDRMKALGRRAGVEGLTFLSFRHSFGTHAKAWGLADGMIQRILRHTSLRTQRHYVHDDVDDLVGAIRRVGYGATPRAATAPI